MSVALVTGAGRDREIGTAVCRALAAAGHRIVFTVQPGGPSDGASLARELGARAVQFDLAAADVTALLDEVGEVPAVLVNNAAYEVRAGFAELDGPMLDDHYAVNVRAPMLLSCELARRWERGSAGRIVCLTSGQSHGPMLGELPYAVTKGAIETFVAHVAPELMALGITINAVNPGVTDTGWVRDDVRGALTARMPAGRIGQAEDAARLIAWLCSEEAGWVTGQVISSEGGFVRS